MNNSPDDRIAQDLLVRSLNQSLRSQAGIRVEGFGDNIVFHVAGKVYNISFACSGMEYNLAPLLYKPGEESTILDGQAMHSAGRSHAPFYLLEPINSFEGHLSKAYIHSPHHNREHPVWPNHSSLCIDGDGRNRIEFYFKGNIQFKHQA